MSSADELRDLRDRANAAFDGGRFEEALAAFEALEKLDPNPEWARRAAQAQHGLANKAGEVDALNRAARGYQERGEILKAAVTSKLILALDAAHEETLKRIPQLVAGREAELKNKPRPPPPVKPIDSPESVLKIASAISSFYLRDLLPRTKPGAGVPSGAGIHPLPLLGDVEGDFELDIVIEDPEEVDELEELGADPLRVDSAGNIVAVKDAGPGMSGAVSAAGSAAPGLVSADLPPSSLAADALKSTLFAELAPEMFTALLENARVVDLKKDQELFHQGEQGDTMYVIVSGTLGVIDEGPPRRGVTKLGERKVFGEIALLTNQPRTATIIALSDAQLIAIDRDVVGRLTAKDSRFLDVLLRFLRDRLVDRLLSSNPLFTVLSERDRSALKPRFRLFEVDAGAVLIEEGKKPDGLLILLAGHASVVRKRGDEELVLGRLAPGDIAGEISLLTNIPAIGTVKATERSLAVILPAAAFQTIVHARPDAMIFVQKLIDQRTEQAKEILAGAAPHVEGHVRESP